jgi:hypothetical protein
MSNAIRYDDHLCMHELLHSWKFYKPNIHEYFLSDLLTLIKTTDTIEVYVNMYTLHGIPSHMENLLVDIPNIKTVRFILDEDKYNYVGYIPYKYHSEPDWNNPWIPKVFDFPDNVKNNLNIEYTFDINSIVERETMPQEHFNKNIEYLKCLQWNTYETVNKFSYTFDKHYGATAYWFDTLNRYNPEFTKQHWDQLVTGKY